MSEPLARARRVVAVGAAALAVVIVALGAAAWRLVEAETTSAAARGRSAATIAVQDFVRTLADTVNPADESTMTLTSEGTLIRPTPPTRFKPAPPLGDPEGAFYIRESAAWSADLRRSALRRALQSTDATTRVAAAAEGVRLELREGTGKAEQWTSPFFDGRSPIPIARLSVPDDTRDGVLLQLVGPIHFFFLNAYFDFEPDSRPALAMVGGDDDDVAAAMLVAVCPGGTGLVRERRAELAEAAARSSALRAATEVDGRFRVALLASGQAIVATKVDDKWFAVRRSVASVQRAVREVLEPRLMRLVAADAAALPVAVPIQGEGCWAVAASFSESETRSRSTLLVVGLGVAAGAAVLAFAAFARSARREARLAALRTDFVATVSHELRTPVAVVRTSAETLASGRATRAEDKQALTEAIVRESERLSTLVGNVLDFARMESGRRTYAMRTADVGALVRDVASRHAGVEVEIAVDVPSIACDADALGGAVGNLLDNARKYSSPDTPVVARVARRGGDVVVEVEDHGFGVPDAEKRHVFERFFRGADPRVRDTRGAGIGLALVEHAARAHGGRVEVVDTPGGGATFRIALPIAQNG